MPAAWKTVRVFISSTFRDMQAERDHLVRFVFPKLREELVKFRIHLVDVDLRWGVTGDQDALEVCREVIDECHPRFMCMLGGRYGWVPEGQDKSITADEIHYGVLGREAEKRGHAFFYFRREADTLAIPDEAARAGGYREFPRPDEIERHGAERAGAMARERAQKLITLKKAIADAGLPVFIYDGRWDTAQKRLTGLEAFGTKVQTDLLQSLEDDPELAARFTDAGTATPDEFAEETDQMDAFIEERTDRFILGSRDPLMRDMLAFAAAEGTPNIFVLTGEPGSGKSAFLAKFTRDLTTLQPSPFIIPHFIGASTGSTDLRRTLRRLCHELALAAGNTEPLPLDIKDLITHFHALLTEVAGKQRIILVFDALNQFDATDGAHWLNWLPRELPLSVRIVASVIAAADGEKEHQTLAILRNRKDARVENLKPLSWRDTVRIMRGYLRRFSKHMDKAQKRALLAKPAGRLPLYVLTALEELRTLGTYDEITDRIRTLPGDARALFGWILTERLARDPGFRDHEGRPCGAALVGKFAACLGVSRHGLSPAELAALLDPGDPLGNVAALLRLLRPYLMQRGELLDFYHGQFREAAGAAHLGTPEKQRAAHQSVASCLQAFADPHRGGQCRDAAPHALSELPHHQTRAEVWPDLIATLENIFFLEAKVAHGMTFDLAVDFTAAVNALPPEHTEPQRLRLLDEALRRDIHFIHRHREDYPQALFQCLWNSCWWYDCPESVPHYKITCGHWSNGVQKMHALLERWRQEKNAAEPSLPWLLSLRPPAVHLGTTQVAVLRGHEGAVTSVAHSPDGLRIASGSDDQTVRVWDAASGDEVTVLSGHGGAVTSVGYSPDGLRITSGSGDRIVRVWDVASGSEVAVLRGHEGAVTSVNYSPDGLRIASGSIDKTVRVWDAATGAEMAVLRGHKRGISSVVFSPDGNQIVSGSHDQTVRLWDAQNSREMSVLRGHESQVQSVRFSPDGQRIVSTDNMALRIWDARSGAQVAIVREHVSGGGFSANGRLIAAGAPNNTVRVWDIRTGIQVSVLHGHERDVSDVSFSPDGRSIVSGSADQTVRIWNAERGAQFNALPEFEHGEVSTVRFSPDGRLVASGSNDQTVHLWGATTGEQLAVSPGRSVEFSPDGVRIAIRSASSVQVWNISEAMEPVVLQVPTHVVGLEFSPDGQIIAMGSGAEPWGDNSDNLVRLWDPRTGAELAAFGGHEKMVLCVSFSRNGRLLASGSLDETVRIWDLTKVASTVVLRGHKSTAYGGSFSPDGSLIATCSGGHPHDLDGKADNTVRVWETRTGAELGILYGHSDWVMEAHFSPDGLRIVSSSMDGTLRVWDARSYRCLEVIQGFGDAAAIAIGPNTFAFRLLRRGQETVLEESATGHIIAYLPAALRAIDTHPSGRVWGGGLGAYLALVQLEGIPNN